jgi:ankyrin repeat protein
LTTKDNAQDQELLDRYKRASDTQAAAPSDAVRAAILAEARRVAEQRAAEVPPQAFEVSRPAANDSRWKITAFGTAGAALVAALLFAPRLWESAPPAPSVSNTTIAASADKAAPSEAGAAQRPKLESLPASPNSSETLQEVVVTQGTRESSKAAGAASPKFSAPAAPARPSDEIAAPKATEVRPRMDLPAPPQRQRTETTAQSVAPAGKTYPQNYAPAAAPPTVPPPAAHAAGPRVSSLNAQRAALAESAPVPPTLLSAAASGDTAQTTALLDQGAARDARDELGRTPLMLAVMQRRVEVVRLLLDHGADPNIADNTGRTPLQQAKQQNLREIAAMLERAGAR